jgi:hypothetical protein
LDGLRAEKRPLFHEKLYKMYRQRNPIVVIAVTLLVHCFAVTYGQELEAKLAGAKLPTPLYISTAVYDGTDNVYIFGGYVMLILHS